MIKKLTIAKFESNLNRELDLISEEKVNQLIIKRPKGKGNIVLISEAEFNSMQETLYLLSSKKNRECILESLQQLKDGKTVKVKLKDLWK
ncbi:MAG: type II toxin-antitoxin system Phd/YefM family antitoxin [Burkholderiaceae bacterium]